MDIMQFLKQTLGGQQQQQLPQQQMGTGINPIFQQAAQAEQQLPPELGEESNPIVVGRPQRPDQAYSDPGGPEAPNLGNSNILEEAASVRDSAPERSGLFGTKGTLRDILGTVGDAFLVQSGNNPLYQQRRQQENQADAMAGFGQDPMAAMERLAALPGGAEMAQALNQQYQKQMNDYMTQQGNAAKEQREVAADENENYQDFAQQFSNFMGAANKDTWPQMIPILQKMKEKGQLGDEFYIPEEFDPAYAEAIQMGGMPTSRQVTAAQGDRRIGISQQNATSNRMRAERPPAPRAPSNPTEAGEIARIRGLINSGKPLSAGDKQTWDKYTTGGGTRRRGNVTPPASGQRSFTIIRD